MIVGFTEIKGMGIQLLPGSSTESLKLQSKTAELCNTIVLLPGLVLDKVEPWAKI